MAASRPAWQVIAWMCAAHIVSMTPFTVYPALLPELQREWGLSNSAAGTVSGLFFAGYMIAVPVLTSLTDRIDARRVYFASSLVAAVAAASFGALADGLLTASLLQMVCGAGVAGTYMPGLKALTDCTTGAAQSRAVSFYTAFFGAGIAVSVALAGIISTHFGWRTAFLAAALGPPIAGLMVLVGLPRRRPLPVAAGAVRPSLLNFRPVLGDRSARRFVIGYAIHCWELFGSRSWLVAFLSFAQGAAAWPVAPVTIAAIANLCGPFGSIGGNEVALRTARAKVIRFGMASSGLLTLGLGFLVGVPWFILLPLAMLHLVLVMSDSSALTAGLVAAVDPRIRGSAMAVHSAFGFGAGFVAPLVFGAVLDVAGGNQSPMAWGAAFASLGIGAIAGAVLIRWPASPIAADSRRSP